MLEVFHFEKGWRLPALFCRRDFDFDKDRLEGFAVQGTLFLQDMQNSTHHIWRSALSVYGVHIGCFDDINIRDYLATAINDVVSISLAADDADC